uniref:RabBD domain-containing protein n=1 Tax=Taeniopygia guttata TaxID=59729 RepID=A0A674HU10_TAEGU
SGRRCDLSFLNEEEARAIFQVLQRDAELRRAEKDRVRYRLSPPSCRCPWRPRGGVGHGTGFLEGARPQPGDAGRLSSRRGERETGWQGAPRREGSAPAKVDWGCGAARRGELSSPRSCRGGRQRQCLPPALAAAGAVRPGT